MNTFFISLIMGAFGAVAVAISSTLNWPTWIMFMAWVSYYIFGRSLIAAGLSFIQILCGILMGICMQSLTAFFTGFIGPLGFPIAVFLLIGSLTYVSKIKILNNIPGWFMGLIIFFGIHPEIAPLPLLSLLLPIIMGFTFAFLNENAIKLIAKH